MMLLKRLYLMNWSEKLMLLMLVNLFTQQNISKIKDIEDKIPPIISIIFRNFLMVEEIFLSAKSKRSERLRLKTNRVRIYGNYEESEKCQIFIELLPSAWCSSQNENLASTSKNLLKSRYWFFPVLHYFTFSKYLVNDSNITNLATTTFLTAVENKPPKLVI